MEKVKVSERVASLIGRYDWYQSDLTCLEHIVCDTKFTEEERILAINGFINSFEVELSPEEKAKKYWERISSEEQRKICIFLNYANIKIKGVNE